MTAEASAGYGAAMPLPEAPRSRPAQLAPVRPAGTYERWLKRPVDVTVAAVALVLLLPVLVVVAGVVLVGVGRPVLYRQRRVGLGGRVITVHKFRTMRPDRRREEPAAFVGEDRRRTHKSEADPRHTRAGRLLRKCSLDELPQLWDVLRGDMALVGPRPEVLPVVARYEPWQHRRHDVRPGLTGLWQVSARGDRPMHEATEIDLAYVDALSWRTDLRILLSTPGAVLVKRAGS